MIAQAQSTVRSGHRAFIATAPSATAAPAPKSQRDEGLDWVKGTLVVLMVVYHSLNYSPYSHLSFAYIGFLPVSFIFIAGFLLTNSYLARYDVKDWRLHRRLVIRGAKLLVIFTVLNVALYFVAFGHEFLDRFSDNLQLIYIGAAGHVASYPILTSIGYLLLLAPVLLVIGSRHRAVLPGLAVALVLFCSFMEWRSAVSYHLGMISAGIIGTAFGFVPLRQITGFARKTLVVLGLYCVYRTASYVVGEPYALQLAGVVATLLLLYGVALKLPVGAQVFKQVVLMGRYSLLGYIMQLAFIQVAVRLFGPFASPLAVAILTLVALIATWSITFIVDRLRAKARFVDVTYKAAFA